MAAFPKDRGPTLGGLVLVGLLAGLVGMLRVTGGATDDPALDGGNPPGTFFAVRGVGTDIVEVDAASGRVRRTIVDLGHGDPDTVADTGGLIDGLHLSADRRVLWYSRWSSGPGSVYRVELPDGTPERVADGHGASASPDGQRLAFIRGADLVIRDLALGQERVFAGLVGDLGGVQTAWANDSRRLAVEIAGADVSGVDIVDTDTGEIVAPQPEDELAVNYRVISPRYRPSDGLLGVVCCHTGEIVDGESPQNMTLVLHDPRTGAEHSRTRLPFPTRGIDWDATGSHLLSTDGDRVEYSSRGRFRRVAEIRDIYAVAW